MSSYSVFHVLCFHCIINARAEKAFLPCVPRASYNVLFAICFSTFIKASIERMSVHSTNHYQPCHLCWVFQMGCFRDNCLVLPTYPFNLSTLQQSDPLAESSTHSVQLLVILYGEHSRVICVCNPPLSHCFPFSFAYQCIPPLSHCFPFSFAYQCILFLVPNFEQFLVILIEAKTELECCYKLLKQ